MNGERNPVFRGAVYALGAVALIAFFVHMRHAGALRAAAVTNNEQPSVAISAPTVPEPSVPPHINSSEIQARCQPELKDAPSVPTLEVDDKYIRSAVQMKVSFVVDKNGFAINPYVSGFTVVKPADQEVATDYVRHLTFEVASADECQTVKIQMVGNFHMSKNSSGDWVTIFDVHPVYSFNGSRVMVNPN